MKKRAWGAAPIDADSGIESSEPFLYFPQTAAHPELPGERLLVRAPDGRKHRYLIARSVWHETKEDGAPVYVHTTMLTALGIRPGLPPDKRVTIQFRQARWLDVLFRNGKVQVAVAVAVLTLIATGLSAYVTYLDHPKGPSSTISFFVLVVATIAAILNVVQQFQD